MRMATAAIATVAVLLFALGRAPAASAQVWSTLDIGGATVRYDDSVRVTATTLTPRIRFDGGAVAGAAAGTIASLTGGGWTAQGAMDFSVLSSALGPARFELAAEAGGSVHDDATRTGEYLGRARLHVGGAAGGLWAGAATGKTWDASFWHSVVQGDFGAWAQFGRMQLVATVRPSAIGDSLRYADTQGALRWDARRVELALGVGARSGDAIARASPTVWGNASATLWLTRNAGLVAGAGTYPVDFTQGYPGGRYLSLALRLGARPAGAVLRASPAGAAIASRTAGTRLQFATLPNGLRSITVHAPGARRVEVIGDFSAWQPVTLAPAAGGWWTATLPIAPGTYQLNVRVNGAAWDVPAGVLETVDEFGARVGVVNLR